MPELEFNCPKDGTPLLLPEPQFDLINTQQATIAVAANTRGVECLNCHTYYKVKAQGMGATNWGVVEAKKPDDAPRIIRP